jgi:hypothetical protein
VFIVHTFATSGKQHLRLHGLDAILLRAIAEREFEEKLNCEAVIEKAPVANSRPARCSKADLS